MKALFVNGSPRKNWNTHKMLESAMKGAADSGAECELVHLYDLSYKGCVSCFACKVKGSKTNGLCAIRDNLRPVLEKALQCNVIVAGSPVYFSHPTGMIYTMGYPNEEGIKDFGYLKMFAETQRFLEQLFGYSESLYAYNTYQFSDYSRYDVVEGIEPMKAKWRDEVFPEDLKRAYDLGERLVLKAGGK